MKLTLLIVSAFSILTTAVNAQCVIDQSQLLSNGGRSARNLPGYSEGQSFTAGKTGTLCEVDFMMFNTMTGTGVLKIYSGSGVGGALLDTQVVNVNVPTMTSVWQNWMITNPPSVVAGQHYTVQFVPIINGGLPDPYGVNVQMADVYAGGVDISDPNSELTFRTYIDSSNVTGYNSIDQKLKFSLFPNPSNTSTLLKSNKSMTNATLLIYNSLGQQVKMMAGITANEIMIKKEELGKGIFFVRLMENNAILFSDKLMFN